MVRSLEEQTFTKCNILVSAQILFNFCSCKKAYKVQIKCNKTQNVLIIAPSVGAC